jgi:hypothetical protein
MNEKNKKKFFLHGRRPHATLIIRHEVQVRPASRKYDGGHSGPAFPDRFPPVAGGVLERSMDVI